MLESGTRYSATRVPVHEHSRARPRDYIGVRTVGRWDERERIVVRTRRLPTELIGCSSERARRARERERDGRPSARWGCETQKRHGISASETASEAVERRDRIKRGRWETSPGSPAEDKARREEKGSTRVGPARTRQRSMSASESEHACVRVYTRVTHVCACGTTLRVGGGANKRESCFVSFSFDSRPRLFRALVTKPRGRRRRRRRRWRERRISRKYAPEEREENHWRDGPHVEIVLPCPATTCDPAVNPPSFQDPFLPSFLPGAFLPSSATILLFLPFIIISFAFDLFHLAPWSFLAQDPPLHLCSPTSFRERRLFFPRPKIDTVKLLKFCLSK